MYHYLYIEKFGTSSIREFVNSTQWQGMPVHLRLFIAQQIATAIFELHSLGHSHGELHPSKFGILQISSTNESGSSSASSLASSEPLSPRFVAAQGNYLVKLTDYSAYRDIQDTGLIISIYFINYGTEHSHAQVGGRFNQDQGRSRRRTCLHLAALCIMFYRDLTRSVKFYKD